MLAIARFQKMRKGSIFSNLIQMQKRCIRILDCGVTETISLKTVIWLLFLCIL